MLKHMLTRCSGICPDDARAMHVRTNATNATDARYQDQGKPLTFLMPRSLWKAEISVGQVVAK